MSNNYISINRVLFVGRLTKDPELKDIKGNLAHMVRFNLATQEIFYNVKTKKNETRPEFHPIVGWGKIAVFVGTKLKKGRLVIVDGKLRHRYFTNEEGQKRKISQVEIDEIIPLPKRETLEPEEVKEEKEDPF